LSKGHNIKPGNNKHRDWALDRCTYKILSQDEIDSLAADTKSPYAPPKVPFKQSDASEDRATPATSTPPDIMSKDLKPVVSAINVESFPFTPVAMQRRSSKRSFSNVDVTSEEGTESEEPEHEASADSDFQPEPKLSVTHVAVKRARHSISASTSSPVVKIPNKAKRNATAKS
jgi:hypothetical protein